jgi:hypothetical protein
MNTPVQRLNVTKTIRSSKTGMFLPREGTLSFSSRVAP